MRPSPGIRQILDPAGFEVRAILPTHVLLNRELGAFRFPQSCAWIALRGDRGAADIGLGKDPAVSKLLVARRV
jgi:hypothetical protein